MSIENEILRRFLREIVKTKPEIQHFEHKWLIAMLKDLYNPKRDLLHSDCSKEINGLANCLFWGIVDEIRSVKSDVIDTELASRLIRKQVVEYGQQEELSRWCIESWSFVLNKHLESRNIADISDSADNQLTLDKEQSNTYSIQVFTDAIFSILETKEIDQTIRNELNIHGSKLGFNNLQISDLIDKTQNQFIEEQKQVTAQKELDKVIATIQTSGELHNQSSKVNALSTNQSQAHNPAVTKNSGQLSQDNIVPKFRSIVKENSQFIKTKTLKPLYRMTLYIAIIAIVGFLIYSFSGSLRYQVSYAISGKNIFNLFKNVKYSKAWRMFGGNQQHTLQSQFKGPKSNKLKWVFQTKGEIFTAPVISEEGTIYIGSTDDNLYALNLDGSLKWSFKTNSDIVYTPAISSDGTIYFSSYKDSFYAIDSNGKQLWKSSANDNIVYSPTIGKDGIIYFVCDYGGLYATNPDGKVKWNFNGKSYFCTSASIDLDGTIYIGSDNGTLYAVNPDGKQKWSLPIGHRLGTPTIGLDSVIFVSSFDFLEQTAYINAINSNGTIKWKKPIQKSGFVISSPAIRQDGSIIFCIDEDGMLAIDQNGEVLWKFYDNKNFTASPVIGSDGYIYVHCANKSFCAINNEGNLIWTMKTGKRLLPLPFWENDKLIWKDVFHGMYVNPYPDKDSPDVLMWSAQPPIWISPSPAIGADGTLYFGAQDGKLYAIGS